jgi:hypothetical protein
MHRQILGRETFLPLPCRLRVIILKRAVHRRRHGRCGAVDAVVPGDDRRSRDVRLVRRRRQGVQRGDLVENEQKLFALMPHASSRIPQADLRAVEFVKSIDLFGSEIVGYGDRRKIRAADLHVVDQTDEFEVGVGACVLQ